jgi:hypothetical protein
MVTFEVPDVLTILVPNVPKALTNQLLTDAIICLSLVLSVT